MNANLDSKLVRFVLNHIQRYNHKTYWRMREEVVSPNSRMPKLLRLFYLLRIKRMDAFNNASMGTDFGSGAKFQEPPKLPHGLNGIIIHPRVKIGKNCTIYQQVTIGKGTHNPATIGDNCIIGAGAKIIGDVKIGNNVTIGANCVVIKDIPDNCTAVGVPAEVKPKKDTIRVVERESV